MDFFCRKRRRKISSSSSNRCRILVYSGRFDYRSCRSDYSGATFEKAKERSEVCSTHFHIRITLPVCINSPLPIERRTYMSFSC